MRTFKELNCGCLISCDGGGGYIRYSCIKPNDCEFTFARFRPTSNDVCPICEENPCILENGKMIEIIDDYTGCQLKSKGNTIMSRGLTETLFNMGASKFDFKQQPNHDKTFQFIVDDTPEVADWLIKQGFATFGAKVVYVLDNIVVDLREVSY